MTDFALMRPRKPALFPCFSPKSGYIPRHLTRKHGFTRPSGGSRAKRLVCSHASGGTNRRTDTMALPDFSMRQLLEAGVHFGHQSLGAVFRQFALARRHADQLEDDFWFDQAAAAPR